MLRRLLVHASTYSIGSLLVTLAGLISFPIFTRIFSVAEYGVLNLVSSTLLILIGVAKLGLQHSVIRFYAEAGAPSGNFTPSQYFSTVVLGMGAAGALVMLCWAGISQLIPAHLWGDERIPHLLLLTAVLIPVRVLDSGMSNILRAMERSGWLTLYNVLRKYGGLGIILATVFYVLPGLDGFYAGTILAETLAVVVLGWLMLRRQPISRREFSPELYRGMLVFGIPMIAYELGALLLNFGDRYVIQAMLGGTALGHYSASYNLAEYVQMIIVASFGQAVVPMFTKLWEEKGEAATRSFIERALHFYCMIGVAVVFGLAAVGEDVLVLLASEKYRAGAVVIPWIIAATVIDGGATLLGAGLFIRKQTRILMFIVVSCAVLNVVLNVVLIPHFGILGAAIATLASYVVLTVAMLVIGRSRLRIAFPWRALLKFLALGLVMFVSVSSVDTGEPLLSLFVKVLTGVAVYSALVLAFDQRGRDATLVVVERVGRLARNVRS
ncbi:MAG: polysaccharide biosynthesis protein [Alphaproteobacteria bacterium]|jgi:O-antigen/teichoic acid export membrane protein|nr:MAG: polysaccharide biosynthesis protein [Alphaproteobacteria bacterium]